jgi:hypothetical protein
MIITDKLKSGVRTFQEIFADWLEGLLRGISPIEQQLAVFYNDFVGHI